MDSGSGQRSRQRPVPFGVNDVAVSDKAANEAADEASVVPNGDVTDGEVQAAPVSGVVQGDDSLFDENAVPLLATRAPVVPMAWSGQAVIPKAKKQRNQYTQDKKETYHEQMKVLNSNPEKKKLNMSKKCQMLVPSVFSSTFLRWNNSCLIGWEIFATIKGNLVKCLIYHKFVCVVCLTKQFAYKLGKIDGKLNDVTECTSFKCPLCQCVCFHNVPGSLDGKQKKDLPTDKFRDSLFAVIKSRVKTVYKELGKHLINLSLIMYQVSQIDVSTPQDYILHRRVGVVIREFHTISRSLVGASFHKSSCTKTNAC